VHCVVEGGCQLWGLLLMALFVAYVAVTLLKRGAAAAVLGNLVSRRRALNSSARGALRRLRA
jgi:hypothetical protein